MTYLEALLKCLALCPDDLAVETTVATALADAGEEIPEDASPSFKEVYLQRKLAADGVKKALGATLQGILYSYVHQNRIAAVVELACQTDFAARTDEFKALAHDVALQVASMAPESLTDLLEMPWIKDPSKTVEGRVFETQNALKEHIEVCSFFRKEFGK